ncbi:hypothetical protein IAT38_005826 [Cryptococcus sp. DSM 104549]
MSSTSLTASATSFATASASTTAAGLVDSSSNPAFKVVGICLAVGSGLLIGTSFVIKKKGLIQSTAKYGNQAGEGHAYLKSWMWWAGMITMIIGEICNFVAYAFTEAILVTPMGALSVVVAAILSHFLLKEKLTFFGWIGCTLCIMGAVILALNAPEEQSVTTINGFKHLFLSVGFLVWASLLIAGSLVLVFFVAPRWGKKSMLPYISICSLIGGISVSCTQGLGASIVTSIQGDNQVKNWFFWFLFVFVVVTLLTEINYLNKALELFNTSMVVPVYFCFFSSATLVTSFILYQGLKASAVTLITMVLGFLVTCLGITLLQLSKVDPEQLDTKLDRRSTMLMQASRHQTEDAEKGEVSAYEDPGMDALRGGFGAVGSIIRARSVSRRLSNASTLTGKGYRGHNLSTHGLGDVQRFQLSDNPMPSDAMDHISLHSAKSPSAVSGHGYFPSPQRSKSHLKFEEADVVHQYHYGLAPDRDATHTTRPSSTTPLTPNRSSSGDASQGHGHYPQHRERQFSASSAGGIYPPVLEEPEEYDKEDEAMGAGRYGYHPDGAPDTVASAPLPGKYAYSDPYKIYPARANEPNTSLQGQGQPHGHKGLGGIFHFNSGPDLSLHLGNKSGRSRTKSKERERDYPHLAKKDRDDELEREERRGLVGDTEEGGSGSDGEASGSGGAPDSSRLGVAAPSRGASRRSTPGSSGGVEGYGDLGDGNVSDAETRESDEPQSAVSTRATIGMGTRVQVPQAQAQAQAQTQGQQGGAGGEAKKPRRLPDVPGFSAGPPYGS